MRGRSLRTRLTVVLVALAAVGLIVLATITYGSQKQFLEQKVDDQVEAALRYVGPRILDKTRAAAQAGTLTTGADGLATTPFAGAPGPGKGEGRGGPPGGGDRDLPLGTYAELRTGQGTRVGLPYVAPTLDDEELPTPDIPTSIPLGETITVGSTSGSVEYRVRAEESPRFLTQALEPTVTVAAVPLTGKTDQLRQLLLVDAIVIFAILGALGFGASRLVRQELSPLEHIATDADAIAAGELDRRVLPEAEPGTEVGRLGVALNSMLERIEEAFAERQASEDRLRTFLSDASHELRTPLASIRGYAELQRTGMIASEEERLIAVSRIEEQAARMGTLVEDLLALARLDEERAPATDLVELGALARDAVADVGSLDAEREVTLELDGDPLVIGQESKLRQVFTNLLGNAVAHTPAGTPIDMRVGIDGAMAVIDVDDAGPGVPVDVREKIFDRFHREAGGAARTRGPAGAGLGLAVVRGIVEAHQGTVTVGDSPAGGARFEVRLPLVDTSDEH